MNNFVCHKQDHVWRICGMGSWPTAMTTFSKLFWCSSNLGYICLGRSQSFWILVMHLHPDYIMGHWCFAPCVWAIIETKRLFMSMCPMKDQSPNFYFIELVLQVYQTTAQFSSWFFELDMCTLSFKVIKGCIFTRAQPHFRGENRGPMNIAPRDV